MAFVFNQQDAFESLSEWLRNQGTKRTKVDLNERHDVWSSFLSFMASNGSVVEGKAISWSCGFLCEAGKSCPTPEVFWADSGVALAWDVFCFAITGSADANKCVRVAFECMQNAPRDSGCRFVADRLLDHWPEAALQAAIAFANSADHPFVISLKRSRRHWGDVLVSWFRSQKWNLMSKVLGLAPSILSACAADICSALLADASASSAALPQLPSAEDVDRVAQCARVGMCTAVMQLMCTGPWSERPDVASVRSRCVTSFVPPSPLVFLQLWHGCCDQEWLLQVLQRSNCSLAYRSMVLSALLSSPSVSMSKLLVYLWKSLPGSILAESVEQSMGNAAAQKLVPELCKLASLPWPIEMLVKSKARDAVCAVIASRTVSHRVGMAILQYLKSLKEFSQEDEAFLGPIAQAVAGADGPCQVSFCNAMVDYLLSSDADGVFRVTPVVVAPRADLVTTSAPVASYDFETQMGTHASLLTELQRGRPSMLMTSVVRAPSKRVTVNPELIRGHCEALGRVLFQACDAVTEVGFAFHMASTLERACAPLFLLHEKFFDMEAFAASLPRQRTTTTDDVFVESLFAQNPILWEWLDVIRLVPLAASRCHKVVCSLLCNYVGQWYAQRGRRRNASQDVLERNTWRLLDYLQETQCLPYPLYEVKMLAPFARPEEMAMALLSCWRFCWRFPPLDEEYDEMCIVRTFPKAGMNALQELLLPFRLCIADHVDEVDGIAKIFCLE